MGTSVIKISSWNVNGLGSYVKRQRVLSYLKQRNSYVVMLQEAHLLEKDTVRIHDKWIGGAYHNTFNQKSGEYLYYFQKSER